MFTCIISKLDAVNTRRRTGWLGEMFVMMFAPEIPLGLFMVPADNFASPPRGRPKLQHSTSHIHTRVSRPQHLGTSRIRHEDNHVVHRSDTCCEYVRRHSRALYSGTAQGLLHEPPEQRL
jgi:hypothetical protein